MSELKFVITGTAGVGKTTAISNLSDIDTVSTEAATSDELTRIKHTTTVALDFGEIILDEETRVRIYGTPGQDRFSHMWDILAEGALGLIVLVDNSRDNPVLDMQYYLEHFSGLIEKTAVVVGVTRYDQVSNYSLEDYYAWMEKNNSHFPIVEVDPRRRSDMVVLVDTLMAVLEYV